MHFKHCEKFCVYTLTLSIPAVASKCTHTHFPNRLASKPYSSQCPFKCILHQNIKLRSQVDIVSISSESIRPSLQVWQMDDACSLFARRSPACQQHCKPSSLDCKWNQWIIPWIRASSMPPTSSLLSTTSLVRCWTAPPLDEGCVGPRTPGQVWTPWRGWWRREESCRA